MLKLLVQKESQHGDISQTKCLCFWNVTCTHAAVGLHARTSRIPAKTTDLQKDHVSLSGLQIQRCSFKSGVFAKCHLQRQGQGPETL